MFTADNLALPGIRHGFFGREGGHSSGIFSSLNCGYGSGDEPALVSKNRAHVAQSLGRTLADLCTVHQIHSATAVTITKPHAVNDNPQADALVTATPGIVLGALAADCVPILFADANARVIGAAHSGWKGAIGGIIEATIDAMCALGATRENIQAAIGPCIGQASYEVGSEFRDRFLAHNFLNASYFAPGARELHFQFDIGRYVQDRLASARIGGINLLAHDTCLQENEFFSYRRACLRGEPAYGRQISAIVMD